MQVPDAAIAHRRGKAIVEGDAAGHERRSPSVGQNSDAICIDIFPLDQIIHDVSERGFEIGTADDLVELRTRSGAEQIDREQRHAALTRVARHLV